MLSRHFRAHNLNGPERRGSRNLCKRGRGGRPDCRKTTATTLFLTLNWFYSFTGGGGGSSIFQGGPTFSRGGGGVQMLITIKTHITCDFPEGSGPPVPPLGPRMFEQSLPLEVSTSIPESLSLPLDVRKSIQSPRHCNSRLVKVSRVPVIATGGQ